MSSKPGAPRPEIVQEIFQDVFGKNVHAPEVTESIPGEVQTAKELASWFAHQRGGFDVDHLWKSTVCLPDQFQLGLQQRTNPEFGFRLGPLWKLGPLKYAVFDLREEEDLKKLHELEAKADVNLPKNLTVYVYERRVEYCAVKHTYLTLVQYSEILYRQIDDNTRFRNDSN